MKQITKTPEILAKLRTAYGVDATLDNLAVFEVILANTIPLRKAGGLFKGAKLAMSLLAEVCAAVNAESVPMQLQHQVDVLPTGRLFSGAMVGMEARGLIAVDSVTHPTIVQMLDAGTLDQVSLGMLSRHMNCSKCGFDYGAPNAHEFRYDLTCVEGHAIGVDGVHLEISGLTSLFECSFVGQGAVKGARVIGPSESVFQNNARLAASVRDGREVFALQLTATPEETMDPKEFTIQLTAAVTDKTVAETNLTLMTASKATADANVLTLTAQVGTLTAERDASLVLSNTVPALTAERDAGATALAAAVTVLKTEATMVLTAVGKTAEIAALGDDPAALLSVITDNRKAFAAIIPVGGAANASDAAPAVKLASRGAFRSPSRA